MYDSQRVNFVDCLTYLFNVSSNFLFWHRLTSFEKMKQLSTSTNFQNDKNICLIIKVSVHFNNMRMIEEHLDFQLSNKLLYNLLIFQQLFFNHFYCTNKPCGFLSSFNKKNTLREILYHIFQLLII